MTTESLETSQRIEGTAGTEQGLLLTLLLMVVLGVGAIFLISG